MIATATKIRPIANATLTGRTAHPAELVSHKAVYRTELGAAYASDALKVLQSMPDRSVSAVITSPPYALHFKKEYGNVDKQNYTQWMLPYAQEIKRVLKKDGSFVLNIGGSYDAGSPTRSLYHFKLLVALVEEIGFYLAQECFWHNPAKLPSPTEWVNVRRFRIKDSIEYVWWLSPTAWPHADNRQVLVPYSPDMKRLIEKGYTAKKRPSGHNITHKFRGGSRRLYSPERARPREQREQLKLYQRVQGPRIEGPPGPLPQGPSGVLH